MQEGNTYPSLLSQSIWTDGASSIKELRQQPAQQVGLPLGLDLINCLSKLLIKHPLIKIRQKLRAPP
jgi:hypothetical protein